MRLVSLIVAAGICWAGISMEEYRARRAALQKAIPEAVVVVAGSTERERGDLRSPFFQEPNFLYLTGWREPGAILVVAPGVQALFLPDHNETRERYTGKKARPGDANIASVTGFAKVYALGELPAKLGEWAAGRKIGVLGQGAMLEEVRKALAEKKIEADESVGVGLELARLRMVKSAAEVELIQKSVHATLEAHKAAWNRASAGIYEYQVASAMGGVYFERGCERHAYPPIVASGPNAVILHYMANKRRMDKGELLLMDVGAECSDYTADITRTIPVSGKFTPRQREIYEIVLAAQKAAIAAARPGMKFMGTGEDSLNGIALSHLRKHGLEKYYLHTLGHHVGLEVHDANVPDAPLEPGMVITIEPGIYIAEEGIGVRIEDMVLITENGAKVLSEKLPREAEAMERAVSSRNPQKKRVN